ncbi:Zinc finger, CCHC-type [Trema orientale]|uniref:Zinc finger, CCHC-type n=1 Tax=Trema orientale TaxID=63057 RepID=A0A2P5EL18_TREOI|nr:Zinc finger, CCHC-type [Trema orientale]
MNEGTKIFDHLSVLNSIVSKLEAIGVNIEDEDKALRFIWSLPPFYEHIKPILVYGKETVVFSEVTSKLLSEERRLMGGGSNVPSESSALAVDTRKKNSEKKNIICWGCRQFGHYKRNCQKSGAGSVKISKSDDAANVSYSGDNDLIL